MDARPAARHEPAADPVGRLDVPVTYNFREVVATTADGVALRRGALYRSDALNRLTRDGRATLSGLGIVRVVDLRSQFDVRMGGPDRLRGAAVEVVRVPILGGGFQLDLSSISLRGLYAAILTEFGAALGESVLAVADAPGPVVVHCTAGKDRTGLLVALALRAVGVPVEQVLADYEVTAANLAGEWTDRMLRRSRRFRIPVTDNLLEVLAGSPRDALADTLDLVDARYGGVAAYLARVGVDDAAVGRLRRRLLAA